MAKAKDTGHVFPPPNASQPPQRPQQTAERGSFLSRKLSQAKGEL